MSKPDYPLIITGRDAEFSECGKYRYALGRQFQHGIGICVFVMLNPSTADAELDDPTIRRCMNYAHEWGFCRLVVVNIFAWRSTDPKVLKKLPDPIGPQNDGVIMREVSKAQQVICAWGAHGGLYHRGRKMLTLLEEHWPRHLGLTKAGQPKHPLYLKADTQPQRF